MEEKKEISNFLSCEIFSYQDVIKDLLHTHTEDEKKRRNMNLRLRSHMVALLYAFFHLLQICTMNETVTIRLQYI